MSPSMAQALNWRVGKRLLGLGYAARNLKRNSSSLSVVGGYEEKKEGSMESQFLQ
jgi:hypothetical protein